MREEWRGEECGGIRAEGLGVMIRDEVLGMRNEGWKVRSKG